MTSRTPACEDTSVISARLRELDAERVAACNAECEHAWNSWSNFCGKCGLSRGAAAAKIIDTLTAAPEGC